MQSYRCVHCGAESKRRQSAEDEYGLVDCRACGSVAERVVSMTDVRTGLLQAMQKAGRSKHVDSLAFFIEGAELVKQAEAELRRKVTELVGRHQGVKILESVFTPDEELGETWEDIRNARKEAA